MSRTLLALALLLTTMFGSASAQTGAGKRANTLTEALSALELRGLSMSLQFYSDLLAGSPADSSAHRVSGYQFLDLGADLHLSRYFPALRRTHLFTSFHVNGRSGGDFDGVSQSMIGITSKPGVRLAELWMSHELSDTTQLKLGRIDANMDFASVSSATGFLNASFSYDPTFITLPNYSTTSWGGELLLRHRSAHLNLAAFDPLEGTGALLLEETGWNWDRNGLNGRVAVGAWQQTGKSPAFSGRREMGACGYYFIVEQKVWKQARSDNSEESLSAFVQLGSAPSNFSDFKRHLGAGVVWDAPFAQRPEDSAGFAFTRGRFTSDPAAAYDYSYETVLEIYYSLRLNRFVSISPDLQYAMHPAGAATNRNAMAAGARLIFTLKPSSE